jgi:molybdopterin molybdotransferase
VTELATLDVARAIAIAIVDQLAPALVQLPAALGLTLAETPRAANPLPPFDNSAMDGFAVRAADVPPDGRLTLGLAEPICTGMPVRHPMDAVVPLERASPDAGVLAIRGPVRAGDHVRRAGEELAHGAAVLPAGARLTPSALGLLASAGRASVLAVPRPRAAIVVTGDELVDAGGDLPPGSIRDSNGVLLRGLLEEAGAVVVSVERQPDSPDDIRRAILALRGAADFVCTAGGASVGTRDHTVAVLAGAGRLVIRQLAIRPGRPTTMALVDGLPVIALPGNPLAAVAGFEAIARPVVRRLAAAPNVLRPVVRAVAGADIRCRDRLELLPVRMLPGDPPVAEPARRTGSAMLAGSALADGFALVPVGDGEIGAGETVDVEVWR